MIRCGGKEFMKNSRMLIAGIIATFFIWQVPSQAEWIQTNGPYGGTINGLAISGTNLFAGTDGGGVFVTSGVVGRTGGAFLK